MIKVAIMVTSIIAIWFTQQSDESLKKYSCIAGIMGQPFWFYTSYSNDQWGIFIASFFYTYAWMLGFYNYWIKK